MTFILIWGTSLHIRPFTNFPENYLVRICGPACICLQALSADVLVLHSSVEVKLSVVNAAQ